MGSKNESELCGLDISEDVRLFQTYSVRQSIFSRKQICQIYQIWQT